MFERFTDGARRVVVLASEEARRLNHPCIGTEHLLLGLLHDTGAIPGQMLASLGVSLDAARTHLAANAAEPRDAPLDQMPFTPRAKKVLDLSLREALQREHDHIGSEHILLAIIREHDGAASQVLVPMGADLEVLRHHVNKLLGRDGELGGVPLPRLEELGWEARDATRQRDRAIRDALRRGVNLNAVTFAVGLSEAEVAAIRDRGVETPPS